MVVSVILALLFYIGHSGEGIGAGESWRTAIGMPYTTLEGRGSVGELGCAVGWSPLAF